MSKKSRRLLITAALFAIVCGICVAQDYEYLSADGIWVRGDTLIIFARLNPCGGPYRPIQTLVSIDGGKTWAASGPRLDPGRELDFILDTGAELWLAGQDMAEGPTHAPYLLRYAADHAEWRESEIYPDNAELLGIAQETKTGRLLAWVRHIDFMSEHWTGPVYLHQSLDGGQTWSEIKKVRRIPRWAPGLHFFQELPRRKGPWRISRLGSAVEQRQADGKWHPVTKLPLPLQQTCPE
ncbi:MAG TPA: hypothetical protein VG649_12095 [Candidatus Angelobacter sp.]|jgi:hypothetical protein|nr:hypothetical protein [Candidatus Angelobacter sp.]